MPRAAKTPPSPEKAIAAAEAAGQPLSFRGYQGGLLFYASNRNGIGRWRWGYKFQGKQQSPLTLGTFPGMTLGQAVDARNRAHALIQRGIDPAKADLKPKATTVRDFFLRWQAESINRPVKPWSQSRIETVARTWAKYIEATFAARAVKTIEAPELVAFINGLAQTQPATANDVQQILNAVFNEAMFDRAIDVHPIEWARENKKLHGRAYGEVFGQSNPAITDVDQVRKVLVAVEADRFATPFTKLVHRMVALTGLRKEEVNHMQFAEITRDHPNFDGPVWLIPGRRMHKGGAGKHEGRMKMGEDHPVPLTEAMLAVVEAARELQRRHGFKNGRYVFSLDGASPIGRSVIDDLYRRLLPTMETRFHPTKGIKADGSEYERKAHCAHGWRAAFTTTMLCQPVPAETLAPLSLRQAADMALAHEVLDDGKTRRAYDRNRYLKQIVAVTQRWGDLLLNHESVQPVASLIGPLQITHEPKLPAPEPKLLAAA